MNGNPPKGMSQVWHCHLSAQELWKSYPDTNDIPRKSSDTNSKRNQTPGYSVRPRPFWWSTLNTNQNCSFKKPFSYDYCFFSLKKGTYLRRQLNEKIWDLGRSLSVIFHLVGSPSSYKGFSYWSEHQHTHKSRSRRMENESFSPQKGKPILRGKISIVKQSGVYDSGLRS